MAIKIPRIRKKNSWRSKLAWAAAGLPVVAFQIEGTAVGNLACQLVTLGAVEDLAAFRRHFGRQAPRQVYTPRSAPLNSPRR